jgi:2-keto-3-deoxy-L-rhamnonate aldolase RhmA
LTRAAAYGYDPEIDRLPKLFELKNRQAKLILQCEKVGCLEEIEQIAALDGVDGILIGPYDLSTDMGLAGEFGHKQVRAAFQRIKDACRAVGKPVMIFSKTVRDAKARLEEGYDAVAVATVSAVLVDGCRRLLNEANGLAIP